jgi:hypothetical protein
MKFIPLFTRKRPRLPITLSLALHLDAQRQGSITQSAGRISQVRDLSRNNRHAVQANATRQPQYLAGLSGFLNIDNNNQTQADQRHLVSNWQPNAQNGLTILAAVKMGNSVAVNNAWFGCNDASNRRVWLRFINTLQQVEIGIGSVQATFNLSATFMNAITANQRMVVGFRALGTGQAALVYINGHLIGTTANYNMTAPCDSGLGINVINGPTLFSPALGGLGELVAYDTALSLADYLTMNDYLMSKWNIPMIIPNGMAITLPFEIYRNRNFAASPIQRFRTSLNRANYGNGATTVNYYVDPINGNDSNAGTEAAPFASIGQAIQTNNTGSVTKTIWIRPGFYDVQNGMGFIGGTFQTSAANGARLYLKKWLAGLPAGASTRVQITTDTARRLTWTHQGDGVYRATKASTLLWGQCWDARTLTAKGTYTRLTRAASSSLSPGQYFASGNDMFVRLPDSRVPDNDLRVYLYHSTTASRQVIASEFYCDAIEFEGDRSGFFINQAVNMQVAFFDECTFRYSCISHAFNTACDGTVILNRCRADEAWLDCFHYRSATPPNGTPLFIEIDCTAYNGAWKSIDGTIDTTLNCSTAHESCKVVRINSDYEASWGAIVHDIEYTRLWNLGVRAANSLTNDGSFFDSNFRVNNNTVTTPPQNSICWYDSCTGTVAGNGSFYSYVSRVENGGTVNFHRSDNGSGNALITSATANY